MHLLQYLHTLVVLHCTSKVQSSSQLKSSSHTSVRHTWFTKFHWGSQSGFDRNPSPLRGVLLIPAWRIVHIHSFKLVRQVSANTVLAARTLQIGPVSTSQPETTFNRSSGWHWRHGKLRHG